ncbi:TonB-dependent receptor [Daejeonella sp. JGW-45]|uniref:SusC/RagA family TonB-linked outer membrane protein n=1 Tax=Daejeonella sp. JGW-45 TaxID=3034148 RepID=UPI0023EB47FF|nr:TonB-dependent receptor [Daejeonella sp. JGW-45]
MMILRKQRLIPSFAGIGILIVLLFSLPGQAISQELKTITGRVTDAGEPLPGATIKVKGTTRGTTSAQNGTFTIQARSNETLVVAFLGMKPQELLVGNRTTLNVALEAESSSLSEVVVVGYGTVRKPDLTGSVGVVPVGEMTKAPVSSFADALGGRVAGVQASSVDGQPGGGVNIIIRGAGSLTQSTSPLYVVDGMPIEDLDPQSINPEEIESMTVLKDASSTAIYGSRAGNGVILIQTKRGKAGKPVVAFSTSYGIQATPKQMELMSPYEFIKYQQELNPNIATTTGYFAYDATLGRNKTLEDYKDEKGINFQDHVLRTGGININNISLRGGTDQTRYSISGSLTDVSGTIINTNSNRHSGRVTIDQDISNKIKAGVSGNYSGFSQSGQIVNQGANQSTPTAYVLARTWMYRPISPKSGLDLLAEEIDPDAVNASDFRVNPFIDLENQHQIIKESVIDGNGFITYDITKDLHFKSTAIVRLDRDYREGFFNSKTSQGGASPSNVNGVNGYTRTILSNSFTNENTLNYKKTFNTDHTVTGFGLFSINSVNTSNEGYSGRLLPNENLGIDGLDEGIAFNPVSNSSRNRLASYATRWDYSYKSKYLLTALFRADGSSKFVNHWGYFPGGAIAWNMQKEGFFAKAFPGVTASKLRVSYGSNGNNRVGDFDTYRRLNQSLDGYSFNNGSPTGSVYVSAVGNPDLEWEKVNLLDLGYELGLFKGRLNLEVDLYRKTTENLLLNATLPPTTGYSSAIKNIGRLRNDGLEFTLNTVNITNRDFSWESNFNISFNKNKVMQLTRGQQALTSNVAYVSQFNRPLYMAEIGKPAGLMIGYIWEGNYQYSDFDETSPGIYVLKPGVPANGNARNAVFPGDIKYKDLNGDGTMSEADFAIIGRGQPIHTGGFSNNFNYKAFSLNVFLQWSYGNDIYNANRLLLEGNSNGYANINQFASYVNRWTPDNQTNENYRTRGQGPIGFFSSRVVEDGSYLRLKTVALNYNVPSRLIKKAYLSGLSINVAAQNLWTLTDYSGMDPEVSTRNNVLTPGYDYSSYPKSPTVAFGIKASF